MRASDDRHQRSSLLREMATLVAVGRPEEAAALADAALAGGEGDREHAHCRCPPVHSAYATGPEAHELFLASLIPTHNLELIAQRSRSRRYSVCRDRSPGRFLDDLSRFDGTDVWTLILRVRQQGCVHSAEERYLQAAGSASAMTIEIRRPAESRSAAMSI